jgi:methionyl-tRNA formyltransferase
MFRHIVVMASTAQEQFALAALLRQHNPLLSFIPASTAADLATIAPSILREARLVAFASGAIVSSKTLMALGYGAYNFHPGTPAYPGWAPAHFAMYERARSFGATAHLMIERVDSGPIVGTESFIVPQTISLRELEVIAYECMAHLFWRLAAELATSTLPLRTLPIEWGKAKSTRQQYAAMCDIPIDISAEELNRRLAAFNDDFRKMYPTITIHGVKFKAVVEPVAGSAFVAAPNLVPAETALPCIHRLAS